MQIKVTDALALSALVCGIAILSFAAGPGWLIHILAHTLIGLSVLAFTITTYLSEYQRRIDLQKIRGEQTFNGGSHRLSPSNAARLIVSLLSIIVSLTFLNQQFPNFSLAFYSVLIFLPIAAAITLRCCCEKLMDRRFLHSVDQRKHNARSPANAATRLLRKEVSQQNCQSSPSPPLGGALAPLTNTSYTFGL